MDSSNGLTLTRKEETNELVDYVLSLFLVYGLYLIGIPELRLGIDGTDVSGYTHAFADIYFTQTGSCPFYVALPICFLYCLLVTVYVHRRYLATGQKIQPLYLAIGSFYLLFRLIGIFTFPYGHLSYRLPYNDNLYAFGYDGFTLGQRFVSFFNTFTMTYTAVAFFAYAKTYKGKLADWGFKGVLYLIIGLAVLAIIISLATEWPKVTNNIMSLFSQDYVKDVSIQSYTNHRNYFGLILLLGEIALVLLNEDHFHWWHYLLDCLFLLSTLVIYSRTPLFVGIGLLFFSLLFHTLKSKKNKSRQFIFDLVNWGLLLIFALILLILYKENPVIHQNFRHLFDKTTINSRSELRSFASALYGSDIRGILFGYDYVPYHNLITSFHNAAGYSDNYFSSHCGWLDLIFTNGVTGFIFLALVMLYLVLECLYLFLKGKRNYTGLTLLSVLVMLSVYSFFEPRIIFNLVTESPFTYFIPILVFFPLPYFLKKDGIKEDESLLYFKKPGTVK